MEIWKPLKGYEKVYEVSSEGRMRSFKKIKNDYIILKNIERKGYYRNYVGGKMISTHILIAQTFIDNPEEKPYVNHKNGIKTDNRIENLEWVTRSENTRHAYDTGLMKQGKEHCQSKALLVFKDGEHITTLYGNKEWKAFGLDQASVNKVLRGERKHYKGYTFKKE